MDILTPSHRAQLTQIYLCVSAKEVAGIVGFTISQPNLKDVDATIIKFNTIGWMFVPTFVVNQMWLLNHIFLDVHLVTGLGNLLILIEAFL